MGARNRSKPSSPTTSARSGRAVRDDVHGMGIRFASVDGDDFWHVDPVPRVIPAAEWEAVARGLAQRAVALNAYVADVYGQQRIVAEGACRSA